VITNNKKEGLFNIEKGIEVVPCEYEFVLASDIPYVYIKNNGKQGLFNIETGKEVIPCKYETTVVSLSAVPYVSITNNKKEGLFNIETGKEVISCKYDIYSIYVAKYSLPYVQIKNNGKEGCFNIETGKEVVPCNYESVNVTKYLLPYVQIKNNGKEGRFNIETGKEIISCKYDNIGGIIKDLADVNIGGQNIKGNITGGKWGKVDVNTGKEVVPCKYDAISVVSENLAVVNIGGQRNAEGQMIDGKWGYVDINTGKEIIPVEYDAAQAFDKGVARVTKDGQTTLIKNPLKEGNAIAVAQLPSEKRDPNAPAVSRYPAPSSDVDKDIPQTKTNENSNLFAFIIANENYPEAPVPFALNDGRIFKEYCQKTLGLPEKQIRLFEDATVGKIIAAVEQIKEVANAYDGEAEIILYYAGHGVPDEKKNSAWLLPVDGNSSDITTTGYSLEKLYAELGKLNLKSITVFLDACFSGAKREDEMLASARGVAVKVKDEAPKGNMVVFSAATGDETAHQYEEKGHGLFTYFLLKKLQETQGNVNFGELSDYVTKQVKRQSVVINNKRQTPTVIPSATLADKWQEMKLK